MWEYEEPHSGEKPHHCTQCAVVFVTFVTAALATVATLRGWVTVRSSAAAFPTTLRGVRMSAGRSQSPESGLWSLLNILNSIMKCLVRSK